MNREHCEQKEKREEEDKSKSGNSEFDDQNSEKTKFSFSCLGCPTANSQQLYIRDDFV